MTDLFIHAFVTLFVIIDPVGIAPIFAALTEGSTPAHSRKMAIKGSLVAAIVLVVFALVGKPFLGVLGISIPALRVAGGLMLFVIAMEMVFEKRTERKQNTAERMDAHHEDISVFPVAIPLLAGPGAIASIMLLMSSSKGDVLDQVAVIVAMFLVLAINLVVFLFAGRLLQALGQDINAVVTRVLGIILAALAAQFVMDGIKGGLLG